MLLMGRKKDYHKFPVWGLRLPGSYRKQIEKLADETRRTPTEEVKIALEEYLKAKGLWPPSDKNNG